MISSKEAILEILSILKRVSCSSSANVQITYHWNRFFSEEMSTKVFIYSYTHFIEGLEEDSVIGFEKAYYKLKHLSSYHKGVIPSQEDSKSRIFSLILLCAYYAKAIKSKIFAPLDSKTTDPGADPSQEDSKSTISSLLYLCAYYIRIIESKIFVPLEPKTTGSASLEPETTDSALLDPKTTDPGALSFFLKLIHFNSIKLLFSSCGSVDKKFVREFFNQKKFRKLLDKYKFESHQHRYSLLHEILEKLDAKGKWDFKVYLKLVYEISI